MFGHRGASAWWRLPSLRFAAPPFAFRPEFLARLTVQAFGIGLIRARLRDGLFICGAGHRGGCRRRWSLRRRDGGGDDERQDGRAKCHRSHGASSLPISSRASRIRNSTPSNWCTARFSNSPCPLCPRKRTSRLLLPLCARGPGTRRARRSLVTRCSLGLHGVSEIALAFLDQRAIETVVGLALERA